MENTERRGSLVIARCYGDKVAVLKVWAEDGNMVLLSDAEQFHRLSTGLDAIAPIGFARGDVFEYDGQVKSGQKVDWSSLKPYEALSRQ
jgi:hypothetical protein